MGPKTQYPIIVVGAGMSGLTAACELVRSGHEVIVLEAGERIGGRVLTETSALGSHFDLGGQWIGADHHRVKDLVRKYGESTFRRSAAVLPRITDKGRVVRWSSPAGVGALGAAAAACVIAAAMPARWAERRTLGSLLAGVSRGRSRRLLRAAAEVSWTVDPDLISVDGVRRLVRSQHGLATILSASGGAQDALLLQGMGVLADHLAGELGDRVRTNERVLSLRRVDDGVEVQTALSTYRAAKVIVAVPAPVAAAIEHFPALPQEMIDAQSSTRMGSVYKAIAVYDRPFWRGAHTQDLMVLLGAGGGTVFDTSPPGGPGHLCVIIGGASAAELDELSSDERIERILGPLAFHYGSEILRPHSWHDKAWHLDPHVQGGYMTVPIPGTRGGFWPLESRPVGDVHWAGSETAAEHPGYIDGAVEAGQRAAQEVIAALA